MISRPTRRTLLSILGSTAALAAEKSALEKPASQKNLPRAGEFVRFLDGLTENPVIRLTALESSCYLPARDNRAISSKGRFLVFSSDRSGSLSPFRLDLRSGQISPLPLATNLNPASLALDAAARFLYYLEGDDLLELNLGNKRVGVVARRVTHFSLGATSQDLLLIRSGQLFSGNGTKPLAEGAVWSQIQPNGTGCLFSKDVADSGRDLWLLPSRNGSEPVSLAQAPISEPCWAPDGRSALFLRDNIISEVVLGAPSLSPGEQRIGGATPFAAFSSNADSSVFVTVVRSRAQPTVNLLLRNPSRELTLCEDRASRPQFAAPVFSPDSRRVYFNSDFQGRPAIYSVNVETLIEETSG